MAPFVVTASEDSSWAESDRTLRVKFDKEFDLPGPVTLAVVAWAPKGEDIPSDTRIIVFSDADFLTNAHISKYSNARMGLNIFNWVSELDYQIFVDPKEIRGDRLDLTSKQKRLIAIILLAMPVLIAAGGLVVWRRQRR